MSSASFDGQQQRRRRIRQLEQLIAGAGDTLYGDRLAKLSPATQRWLFEQHDKWCDELQGLRGPFHELDCDCPDCFYAALESSFVHRVDFDQLRGKGS